MSNQKKGFKDAGTAAVTKFFSIDTLNTRGTQNTHDTQKTPSAQDASSTQSEALEVTTENHSNLPEATKNESSKVKTRVQVKPRINMAFDEDLLSYLQVMSRLDGVSITTYCNNLVRNDMAIRSTDYNSAKLLFKIK